MKCPNCHEPAMYVGRNGRNRMIYECVNPKRGCKGMHFEDAGHGSAHIEPEDFARFVHIKQEEGKEEN